MTRHVTVELTDAQAEVLDSEAAREDRPVEDIVAGLIQRRVEDDAWICAEIQKGIDAADRGEPIPHEEVVARSKRCRAEILALKSGG